MPKPDAARPSPRKTTTATRAARSHEGGCLCGAIRFRVTGQPGKPHSCSCADCRKHSGALTLTWVEFPAQCLDWIGPGGKPALWRSSPHSSRAFCSICGSTLGAVDDAPTIALVTGAFDRPHLKELAPVGHAYVSRRPRWWWLIRIMRVRGADRDAVVKAPFDDFCFRCSGQASGRVQRPMDRQGPEAILSIHLPLGVGLPK